MATFVPYDSPQVLVLGAGMAGLAAATRLVGAGLSVQVIDKGRGVGGRMATRREGAATFDHGAQYFTARDPAFIEAVKGWTREGLTHAWCNHLPGDPADRFESRWVGRLGMTAPAKRLAQGLNLRLGTTVTGVHREEGSWWVVTAEGERIGAPCLLMTAPVPQSLQLLAAGNWGGLASSVYAPLHEVRYRRDLALLATLEGPSGLPAPGAIRYEDAPHRLRWVGDNAAKGISAVPAITAHSSPEHALATWDEPDEVKAAPMLAELQPLLAHPISHWRIHRWRYAQPMGSLNLPCFSDFAHQLWLAGDAFPGGRVEGAYLSGLAAAHAILSGW